MQIVAEPRREIKDLAKMILSADDQFISWFNMGGWYVDCLWMAILTLPDGDPALDQMLNGLQGSREGIAQNLLRMEIAREETAEFIGNLPTPLVALARAAVRRTAVRPMPEKMQTIEDIKINFYLAALKVIAGCLLLLPWIAWRAIKKRIKYLIKKGGANWLK